MTEYEVFARAEAPRRGIDPDVAVRAMNTEGGLKEAARLGDFSGPPWYSGKSWWALQLHYGGAGYEHMGHTAGMGNGFTALTGWQPGDPAAWRDAMRYGLDRVRSGGWGPWYGPRNIGIVGFTGVDRSVPWSGTPDSEWDYKKRAAVPDNTDIILQRVIALGKTQIGKRYAGPIIGEPDSMRWGNPGFDCSSLVSWLFGQVTNGQIKLAGFTDAAYGQSEWVQNPKPGTPVYYSYPDSGQPGVKFPHVGIWLSPTEVLDCRWNADPSKGGVGIRPHVTPVQDGVRYRVTMLPKGLASVTLADPTPAPVPAPAPAPDWRDARIAELEAHVAELNRKLDEERTRLGVASVDYADGLQNLVNALRALRPAA